MLLKTMVEVLVYANSFKNRRHKSQDLYNDIYWFFWYINSWKL